MNQYSNNLKFITECKLPSCEEKWDTKKIENNSVRNPSNIKGPKDNLTNQNFKEVNFVVEDEEKQNEQN